MPTTQLIVTATLSTPLGEMLVAATAHGLCLLEFADSGRVEPQLHRLENRLSATSAAGESSFFAALQAQLDEYFAGQRRHFTLPLVQPGTPFQQRVWTGLLGIPYGETRSYRALAAALGHPDAARAVGKANGDNPLAILIPCHRLVGAGGDLTGYGGGLWRKEKLLDLENNL